MVLDTSLSLLPCRSTSRPSEASNQDVQRGMVRGMLVLAGLVLTTLYTILSWIYKLKTGKGK